MSDRVQEERKEEQTVENSSPTQPPPYVFQPIFDATSDHPPLGLELLDRDWTDSWLNRR